MSDRLSRKSCRSNARPNHAIQPTGICGGGIRPESKVSHAAYPGRLIAIGRRFYIMRQEAFVPLADRYLMVASRLSPQSVERLDLVTVPEAVRRCGERLGEKAAGTVWRYLQRPRHPEAIHLVVIAAYADLPLGKEYDILFRLRPPHDPEPTRAVLCHVVNWGLPWHEVSHGHHQICVFEFPEGVPSLIQDLHVETDDGRSVPRLGLCSRASWEYIVGTKLQGGRA
jgi:hypothetical protein